MYLDFSQLGSSLGYSAAEPALFRFLHVANVDGRFLDLVVVQKSAYTGCDVQAWPLRAGRWGRGLGPEELGLAMAYSCNIFAGHTCRIRRRSSNTAKGCRTALQVAKTEWLAC